ncbi:MAG: ABC transporter permease, partial [Candidatus Riflebacteria bacterium]|nr:ABC transporter permease [Candidatus Riflebacteria bacterium]
MIKSFIEAAGAQTVLFMQTMYWTIKSLRTGKFSFQNLINQMSIIGVDSFLMVAISGFSLGAVLVVQIGFQFANMGAQSYVGGVVALA